MMFQALGQGLCAYVCVCVYHFILIFATFSVRDDQCRLHLKGEDAEAQLFKDTRVESKEAGTDTQA